MSANHPFLNSQTELNFAYFDKMFDKAGHLIDDAKTELSKISALAVAAPDFTGISPDLIRPDSVTLDGLPALPISPMLLDVPIDNFPASPVLTTKLVATDAILSDLIAKEILNIQYRIDNPTGLKVAVEEALFGRAVDRETKLQRTGYDNYLASSSAMGWSSPSGQDQAVFIAFETEKKGKLSDVNREIMTTQANLEQSNLHRNLELLQAFQAQLFGQKQADEANSITLYGADIDRVIKHAELYININKSRIDLFGESVRAYVAEVGAGIDRAKFYTEQINGLNGLNSQLSAIAMEKIKLLSTHALGSYQATVEAEKGIAAVMAQLSANLFNTLHMGFSQSTGESWSYGESVSV